MDNSLLINKNIDVLVASYGGVGTSFLAKAISNYASVNDFEDNDGYKHLPFPPLSRNKNLKVLYVVGDPIVAVISLFRRDYASYQSYKLNRFNKTKVLSPKVTLDDYANALDDKFNFESVFDNWNEKFQYYPTLVINYSEIHNSLEAIRQFLNLPEDFVNNFPEKIERNSKVEALQTDIQENLNTIYGNFSKRLNKLPPYYIKPKQKKFKYYNILCHPKYLKGLLLSFYWVSKQKIKKLIQ